LSACQKIGALSKIDITDINGSSENSSAGVIADPSTPGERPASPTQQSIATACQGLMASEEPLVVTSVEDQTLASQTGNVWIDAVRNLTVQTTSGNLVVLSAARVSNIQAVSGSMFIHALDIGAVQTSSGVSCFKADQMQSVTTGSGIVHVRSQTLDSLKVGSGTVHLYGVSLGKLEDGSHGNVCLHDGAKIINMGPQASSVISDDCTL
jgi:hypothetical protein